MTDVTVEFKFVRNLSNFESAHVTYGITDTVRPDETVDQAYARCTAKVDKWVVNKIKEIDSANG